MFSLSAVPDVPTLTSMLSGIPNSQFPAGETASLICASQGATTFKFKKENISIQEFSYNSSYEISNFTKNDHEGVYTCEVKNGDVSAESGSQGLKLVLGEMFFMSF